MLASSHAVLPPADTFDPPRPAIYRPRHPERTDFYRLFETHFETYRLTYDERFLERSGPLRPVVERTVEAYLECGRLLGGFARLRCASCGGEHLLAFSCQTRNFCPSCQTKRAALLAEKLADEILAPVPHRHYVFTIPRSLRGLFERDRELLGDLSRWAYAAVRLSFQALFDRKDVLPGAVASIQTFGAYAANFHPHIHMLAADGVWTPDGEFLPLPSFDPKAIEEVFRRLVLDGRHRAERLSGAFRERLYQWVHSGFSVFAEQVLQPTEPERLAHLARYIARPPVALAAIQQSPDGSVLIQTPPHPRTGKTEIVMDPLDWIHTICNQIPDPGQHLVRYYGAYANKIRSRRLRREEPSPTITPPGTVLEDGGNDDQAAPSPRRQSWRRLIKKLFEVDPLLCPKCLVEMKIVAVITQVPVIDKILNHIRKGGGHDPFDVRAPPPD